MTRSTLGFTILTLSLLGGPRVLAETPSLALTLPRHGNPSVNVTKPVPPAGGSETLAGSDRMQWFREARYGMFVHFGPFSLRSRYQDQWKEFSTRPAEMPVEELRGGSRRTSSPGRGPPASGRNWPSGRA